jgi:hypothetical protein
MIEGSKVKYVMQSERSNSMIFTVAIFDINRRKPGNHLLLCVGITIYNLICLYSKAS